jgi:pantothenate synthetase
MRIFDNQPLALYFALNEEKRAGKFIGRFGTTGHIHDGHLVNLKKMRARCDILVVSFVYYFPALFSAISHGSFIANYHDLMERDFSILSNLDFPIEYVSFDYLDRQIFYAGMENRELIDDDPIFNNFSENVKNSDYVKTYVASLMTRPRHESLADVSWISEKDGLPLITAIRLNPVANYKVCPAVRRPDGALYDSKDQVIPESLRGEKHRLGKASGEYQRLLHENRTVPEIEEEIRHVLGSQIEFKGSLVLDLDTMENVNSIRKNIYFEFVATLGNIRFTDAKVMAEDKKLWLPVEMF